MSEIGADIGSAARGAVIGVLRGTKEVGGEALDAVTGTIVGVKVVLKEPFRSEKER